MLQVLAEFMPDGVLEGVVRGLALVVEMRSAIRRFSISKFAFRRLVAERNRYCKRFVEKGSGNTRHSIDSNIG